MYHSKYEWILREFMQKKFLCDLFLQNKHYNTYTYSSHLLPDFQISVISLGSRQKRPMLGWLGSCQLLITLFFKKTLDFSMKIS